MTAARQPRPADEQPDRSAPGGVDRAPLPLRVLRKAGLIVLGVVLWATSAMMFSGYPQVHSQLLSWLAVAVIAGTALVIWIRSERRGDDR